MSAFWQSDPTSTSPPSYTTTAEESVTLACDVTALLVDDDPPGSPPPPAKLYRVVDNGADVEVAGLDVTTVNGNVLSQRLSGLEAGVYRLRWRFVTSGNTRTCSTVIRVVE